MKLFKNFLSIKRGDQDNAANFRPITLDQDNPANFRPLTLDQDNPANFRPITLDQDNPSNFRPITLDSIPVKVFTSCLRNKIFQFLAENNYTEHKIQTGFTPKLSGTLEHTAQVAHIINNAPLKQIMVNL